MERWGSGGSQPPVPKVPAPGGIPHGVGVVGVLREQDQHSIERLEKVQGAGDYGSWQYPRLGIRLSMCFRPPDAESNLRFRTCRYSCDQPTPLREYVRSSPGDVHFANSPGNVRSITVQDGNEVAHRENPTPPPKIRNWAGTGPALVQSGKALGRRWVQRVGAVKAHFSPPIAMKRSMPKFLAQCVSWGNLAFDKLPCARAPSDVVVAFGGFLMSSVFLPFRWAKQLKSFANPSLASFCRVGFGVSYDTQRLLAN